MTAVYQRGRRDPTPLTQGWEAAFGAIGLGLIGLAVAALAGLALAAALFGGGWVWPHGAEAIAHTLGGLAAGHPGRGLPPAVADRVAEPVATYSCVVVCELVLLIACTAAGVGIARRLRTDGMATRRDARQVLGLGELHAGRGIIRPDVYGPAASSSSRHAARFDAADVGWRLGRSHLPRGVELWCRYDRTCGVYGDQGSGKTLDVLAPALLAHRGAGMATLTKVDDLLLTAGRRQVPLTPGARTRPIAVLDPFGAAPGLPQLTWDPVAGCVDPTVASRRARAFAAGTVSGAVAGGRQDSAARFYAAETAKVLMCFLHAAALTGRSMEHVLEWVSNPIAAEQPAEILHRHPHAAPRWHGLLSGALYGSAETVGNTITTVQQAMDLFFNPDILARCVPTRSRPATDVAELIAQQGTVYLLGREDPYASAAPLMTAVAEHVLDTALWAAISSPHGRLTPSFLACLDELPSTAPLPTLRTRMANERALGLSFIYASQTWKQMVVSYGEDEARSLFGLTNTLVIFGSGKDVHFYRELSDLIDDVRATRQTVTDGPGGIGTSRAGEWEQVLRAGDIRRIPPRHALVIAGNAPPIIAKLRRCLDGADGAALKAAMDKARAGVTAARAKKPDTSRRTEAALAYSRAYRLTPPTDPDQSDPPRHGATDIDTSNPPVGVMPADIEPSGGAWP